MRSCWFVFAAAIASALGSPEPDVVATPVLDTHFDPSLFKVEGESHEFRAETGRLMDIIVNSLYTERDVFLRELVSNGADALEKVRVQGLKNASIYEIGGETFRDLNLFIKLDKPRGEISIIDTGIGMTKEELANNLGTVAKSGTEQFIEAAQRGASASNLIGQFGVGFYSAYLVADEITVVTKSPYDDKQWVWQSSSQQGGFKIYEDPRPDRLARGTVVTLKLKSDAKRFLSKSELRRIAKRFSSFVAFPLYLGEVTEDVSEDDVVWQKINSDKPIWLQDKSEIEPEQYESFYRNMTGDSTPPLTWIHFKAEGDVEFNALMYVPDSGRKDIMHENMGNEEGSDVKLYVQRVLISDKLADFFPNWLGFVKGVVDSNDLPLKVDRETFSSTRVMRVIKKKTISKILDTFRTMSRDCDLEESDVNKFYEEEPQLQQPHGHEDNKELLIKLREAEGKWFKYFKYTKLWDNFGQFFMLGCMDSAGATDRPKLLSLFRGKSSTQMAMTSLDSYLSRMRPGQKHIYYVTGDDAEVISKSPYLEFFHENKIEVLYLLGTFDEGCFSRQKEFKGHQFRSVERDTFDIDEFAFLKAGADVEKQKEVSAEADRQWRAVSIYYKPLLDWVESHLGLIHAQYVTITRTLVNSPAKVSSPQHGFTAATERMARTSPTANKLMVNAFAKMKTFELNPHHWLVHDLLDDVKFQNSHKTQDLALQREVNRTIDLIYETALIASGYPSRRPHVVTNALYGLLALKKRQEGPAENFKLKIPEEVYIQVDRELKTKAAKEKLQQSKGGDDVETGDEDENYEDLFDHDEL